jgi:translation elongation factor EF-Tu-like GTPase
LEKHKTPPGDAERGFLLLRLSKMMKQESNIPFDKAPADFKAKVRLLTAEEGGRKTPAHIGYRPQVYFETEALNRATTSGSWQKMNRDQLFPGETAEIEIAILGKEFCRNKLFVGLKFRLMEGVTQIGAGEILEICNEELRRRKETTQ